MIKTFDILTSFPLFKGLSYEALLDFVGRTPLDFKRAEGGSTIIARGDKCQCLIGLITGKLRVEKLIYNGKIRLWEDWGPGTMIGLEYLFGRSTFYPFNIRSIDECGLIEFPKENCISLMLKQVACFLNYQNIVCSKAQRSDMIAEISGFACLENFIEFLTLYLYGNPFPETLHIIGDSTDMKELITEVFHKINKIPEFAGETRLLTETHLILRKNQNYNVLL